MDRWHRHQELRFLIVGALNTALGYGLFVGLFFALRSRCHYLGILVATHVLSVSNSFLWHKKLTFKTKGAWLKEYLRFNVTYLASLGVGMVGLPFLVERVHLHPLPSQGLLTLVTVLGSYFMHRHVSFRRT